MDDEWKCTMDMHSGNAMIGLERPLIQFLGGIAHGTNCHVTHFLAMSLGQSLKPL
jgi:hypothetical protein